MGLPLAGHYIKTHALTFKREKIVVSFTLDGVDYLGDYHVKNVIFGRPPFCVVVAVLRHGLLQSIRRWCLLILLML